MNWLSDLGMGVLDLHDILVVCAWVIAAGIVFLSLGPESIRPHLAEPEFERFVAYFALGLLFSLAYPDQPVIIAAGVVAAAVVLEALQYLLPHRHAHFPDARHGAMGGFLAVVLCATGTRLYVLEGGPKLLATFLKNFT